MLSTQSPHVIDLLLLVLDDEMAHRAAAIQPLFQVQGDGGASHFNKVGGAGHGRFGAASTSDHHVGSLAGADSAYTKER